jgi:hypothetical protein
MPIFAKSYNVSHTTIIRVIEAASKDYPLSPERMAGFLFVQSQSCPPGMASLGSTQHSSASSDADCKHGMDHVTYWAMPFPYELSPIFGDSLIGQAAAVAD